jgi:hypothetical protein
MDQPFTLVLRGGAARAIDARGLITGPVSDG